MRPAGAGWNKELIVKIRVFTIVAFCLPKLKPLVDFPLNDIFINRIKHIGATLEKEHSENEVFVRGRIQAFTAENIGSAIEMAFEFG